MFLVMMIVSRKAWQDQGRQSIMSSSGSATRSHSLVYKILRISWNVALESESIEKLFSDSVTNVNSTITI